MISALLQWDGPSPLWNGARRFWSEIWPTGQRDPAIRKSDRGLGVSDGSEVQPISGGPAPGPPCQSD